MKVKTFLKLLFRIAKDKTPRADFASVCLWNNFQLVYRETIPPIIWIYWHDKEIDSPLVNICLQQISKLNLSYSIKLLNKDTVKEFVDNTDKLFSTLPVANVSDYIRLSLLKKYGGFYLDASVFLFDSLDWLSKIQENNHSELVGYYTESNTLDARYPMIETWCLGAIPQSRFVSDWLEEYEKCLLSDNPDTYYIKYQEEVDAKSIPMGTNYHKCYFSAQEVMRRSQSYSISLIKADNDAFLYTLKIKHPWSDIIIRDILLVNKAVVRLPKMVKLISTARKTIDRSIKDGYYKKDSIIGKLVK